MTTHIPTKIELAKRLQITRPTLDKYLALPGAPECIKGKGWDFEALVEFISENASRIETASAGGGDLKAVKVQEIKLRCEKLRHQIDVEKDLYVPKSEVDAWQTEKAESLKRLLSGKLINEMLPKMQGLGIPEQIPIVRNYITTIIADFKKPFKSK